MAKPELAGQVPFFLENFLSRPASALPKGAQWILVFEGAYTPSGPPDYPEILPVKAIKKGIRLEPRKFNVDEAIDTTIVKDYQQTKGCLFAQAVQVPGDSYVANPEGLQQSGYIRSYIGGGRNAFEELSISFLETNVSFVENVIRPWVIATSHLGMIARSGPDNYRCNITIYKLGVISPTETPFVLQKFTFYGICPTGVTGEEYNYTQVSSPVNREATFTYHYYSSESSPGNSAIINNNASIPVPLSTEDKNISVSIS